MVRHGDLELIITKEELYTHRCLGTGSTMLVSGCPGSSSGVTWGKGNLALVSGKFTEEAAGSVGSGQVGSHRRSLLSLGISLPWEGQSLEEQGSKRQSDKKIENAVSPHGAGCCYLTGATYVSVALVATSAIVVSLLFLSCYEVYRVGFLSLCKGEDCIFFLSSDHNERLPSRMY